MAIVTKPADYTAGTGWTSTLGNDLKNPIYNEFNGNIDDANVKAAAAIAAAKISGTAAVLGGGATQNMTNVFKQTAPYYDTTSGNRGTLANSATPALVAGKLIQATGGTTTITDITGGAVGEEIWLSVEHNVTITHTGTDTANKIHLKAQANKVATASAANPIIIRLVFGNNGGGFTNSQWLEV